MQKFNNECKEIGAKGSYKMLVKLTTGVRSVNMVNLRLCVIKVGVAIECQNANCVVSIAVSFDVFTLATEPYPIT